MHPLAHHTRLYKASPFSRMGGSVAWPAGVPMSPRSVLWCLPLLACCSYLQVTFTCLN